MDISGKNILVIGGAGFIGSHLVDQLIHTDVAKIVVFDNFSRGSTSNLSLSVSDDRIEKFEGDINHTDVLNVAMQNADCVFHLAALWLLHCYEYPRAAFKVNIEGTFNVLEACVNNNVDKLIYSSSASVYGDALYTPMTEEHPYNNRTFYGATKISGEHMCRSFHERYGLDYIGLRYMNVYGQRQDYKGAYTAVMMKMLDSIEADEPIKIFGDGSQTYDFIDVRDVAYANLCASKSYATDEFYNVGMGKGTTITELAEILLELTKSDVPIEYQEVGQTFVTHRIGSTDKAKQDLGFEAKIEVVDGLRDLVSWRDQDKLLKQSNPS